MFGRRLVRLLKVLWLGVGFAWGASYVWIPSWYGRISDGDGAYLYEEHWGGFALVDGLFSVRGTQVFVDDRSATRAQKRFEFRRRWGGGGVEYSMVRDVANVRMLERQLNIQIPLWWIFVVTGLPVGVAFGRGPLRARRRRRQGLCARCGYSLEGNESGACPECGLRAG